MKKRNDIRAICTRCWHVIRHHSSNVQPDGNKLNVDGTPRLMHKDCKQACGAGCHG